MVKYIVMVFANSEWTTLVAIFIMLSYPYIMPTHIIRNLTENIREKIERRKNIVNKIFAIKYSALYAS